MVVLLQISEPGQRNQKSSSGTNDVAVGIDLGTTNSLVAFCKDSNEVNVLLDDQDRSFEPSVVFYEPRGDVRVGHEGIEEISALHSIKRLMGTSADSLPENHGFESRLIRGKSEDEKNVYLKVGGDHTVTPAEVSSEILKSLKKRAEKSLGQSVTKAVITVPAYFDEAARVATREAATLAGLEVLRLINEPTAAAYAYGLDSGVEGVYAFYDLGGGTFDFTLLKLHQGIFQVLATGGDTALGGDDIDRTLLEELSSKKGVKGLSLRDIRTLKEELSEKERVICGEEFLTRTSLETIARPFIEKTLEVCQRVCRDAKLSPQDVEGVVLVGGVTRMPLVRRAVASLFGKAPLVDCDPDQIVALGAALQAKALTQGSESLLLDVTPLSLGLETMGGLVERLIDRNSPLPAQASQTFTTQKSGQTAIAFHIVQGEREMASDCRSLAHFELAGLPAKSAGACRVIVSFSLDADGLLHVEARDEDTGVSHQLDVRPSYGLREEEMVRLLQEAGHNASEDMVRRLLAKSQQKGHELYEQVTQALKQDGAMILSVKEGEAIEAKLKILDRTLGGKDRESIEKAMEGVDQVTQDYAKRRVTHCVKSLTETSTPPNKKAQNT
ncbi:MAG: Fe-S protein assembly chaperone HscA [bacterium]|nr:Fe-S protein assembly chaperone HscA [bacterium]